MGKKVRGEKVREKNYGTKITKKSTDKKGKKIIWKSADDVENTPTNQSTEKKVRGKK